MRTLVEIQKEIDEAQEMLKSFRSKLKRLEEERSDILFSDFLQKNNLKKGDVIETTRKEIFIIAGPSNFLDWIRVFKTKKDGNPSKVFTDLSQSSLKDCKVIDHKELYL